MHTTDDPPALVAIVALGGAVHDGLSESAKERLQEYLMMIIKDALSHWLDQVNKAPS